MNKNIEKLLKLKKNLSSKDIMNSVVIKKDYWKNSAKKTRNNRKNISKKKIRKIKIFKFMGKRFRKYRYNIRFEIIKNNKSFSK